MRNLTFKVSAKTARLFGRENASNAEGAIAELIKNTYDADATACLVCFLPAYHIVPEVISSQEFEYLLSKDDRIQKVYDLKDNGRAVLRNTDTKNRKIADELIQGLINLWIIDNGTGMSGETIEECWMVIGTNDKEKNVISNQGRARTGAKGIGRFALDRLGNRCTLYSSSYCNEITQSIKWDVDWSDFDGSGKVLDDISATLDEQAHPLSQVLEFIKDYPEISDAVNSSLEITNDWRTGTAIQIALLRDSWTKQEITRLYKTLGALIPLRNKRN